MRNIYIIRSNFSMTFCHTAQAECKESLRQDTSLSADTASARGLLEITSVLPCTEEAYYEALLEDTGASCGVFGHVLFPQESTYLAYAISEVLIFERIKLVKSVFHGAPLTQIENHKKLRKNATLLGEQRELKIPQAADFCRGS